MKTSDARQYVKDVFGQHTMPDHVFAEFTEIKDTFKAQAMRVLKMVPEGHLRDLAIEQLRQAKDSATMAYLTDYVARA